MCTVAVSTASVGAGALLGTKINQSLDKAEEKLASFFKEQGWSCSKGRAQLSVQGARAVCVGAATTGVVLTLQNAVAIGAIGTVSILSAGSALILALIGGMAYSFYSYFVEKTETDHCRAMVRLVKGTMTEDALDEFTSGSWFRDTYDSLDNLQQRVLVFYKDNPDLQEKGKEKAINLINDCRSRHLLKGTKRGVSSCVIL